MIQRDSAQVNRALGCKGKIYNGLGDWRERDEFLYVMSKEEENHRLNSWTVMVT